MTPATLTGLPLDDLAARLGSRTRALAARKWLFETTPPPATLPERIPGVSPEAWAHVRAAAPLPEWRVAARRRAADGTTKLALALAGATVETVLIPRPARSTVCVSSQAGCTRHCRFCATATLGFARHLTAGEMVLQYAVARAEAPRERPRATSSSWAWASPWTTSTRCCARSPVSIEDAAPRLSTEHVTVSTSGVLPGMRRFLRESRAQPGAVAQRHHRRSARAADAPQPRLAHRRAARRAARGPGPRPGRRYFVEYVLWDGVNDTDADARAWPSCCPGCPRT